MPCGSPCPYSRCLPLQIPSQPHSRQPGLSPACCPPCRHPPGCGIRCRFPRSSDPRQFRMHREAGGGGGSEANREKTPRETPALGETGRRGPAEPGGGVPQSPRAGASSRSAYLQTGEWGRLAQVRTASPEVSRSESINTKTNGFKKKNY